MSEIILPISLETGQTIVLKIGNSLMVHINTVPIKDDKPIDMISLKDILTAISEVLNIDIKLLYANNRKHEIVYARNCYYYIARYLYNYPLGTIGKEVRKDRTSVKHGIHEFQNKRSHEYKLLINYINLLKTKFPTI